MELLNPTQLLEACGFGTRAFYEAATLDDIAAEMRKARVSRAYGTLQIARSYFALRTVTESEALDILTNDGDYSPVQARIILGHARKWRFMGKTVYSRQYIETRVGSSLPR